MPAMWHGLATAEGPRVVTAEGPRVLTTEGPSTFAVAALGSPAAVGTPARL